MSHTRRASAPIRVDQSGVAVTSQVDELIADPLLQAEAQRAEAPKGASKTDSLVAKEVGGPAVTARDVIAERLEGQAKTTALADVQKTIPNGGAPRVIVENAIARMSADGFSPQSQREFIKEVKKLSKLKSLNGMSPDMKRAELSSEQKHDLAWMADVIRDVASRESSTPAAQRKQGESKLDLGELSEFFGDHGLRLRWFDKLDNERHFSSLDRTSFRSRLKVILGEVERNGGVMTKTQLDSMLGMLEQVTDIADMKFARWQIQRRVMAGQLEIPETIELPPRRPGEQPREVRLADRFDAFMAEKLDDQIDVRQIGFEARALRLALQNAHGPNNSGTGMGREELLAAVEDARERLKASIDLAAADKSNPDALFYAKRALSRELGSKCGLPEGDSCKAELLQSIDSRIGDRLDRHSRRSEIDKLVKQGKLTENEALVARLGVAVSTTNTEYRSILPRFDDVLGIQISSIVLAAMAETFRVISENIGGGTQEQVREQRLRDRLLEERLRDQRLAEDRIFNDVQRAKQSNIRLDQGRRDIKRTVFHRVETRDRLVSVLFRGRESRRLGAQTARSGAFAQLTVARTPEQVSRALGQINQFTGEAAKNSGPSR